MNWRLTLCGPPFFSRDHPTHQSYARRSASSPHIFKETMMPTAHLDDYDLTCNLAVDYTYHPGFPGDLIEEPQAAYVELFAVRLYGKDITSLLPDEALIEIAEEIQSLVEDI